LGKIKFEQLKIINARSNFKEENYYKFPSKAEKQMEIFAEKLENLKQIIHNKFKFIKNTINNCFLLIKMFVFATKNKV
jgi:hypothetical protein